MATRTYLIFGDVESALDTLRVECTKCPRKGRYSVRKLIEKYGRKGNMMKWKEQLNGDPLLRQWGSKAQLCFGVQSRRLLTRPSQSSPCLYLRTLANSAAVRTRPCVSRTNHGPTKCALNPLRYRPPG